ncbi:ketodeoxygluconokinase [Vibrio ponticus]|uniref:Ketodeoxygluconokinase n=1 Tax=Vibrio ponticus TaxID=265668 RepID=A0ABX3FCZ6_9VIBR|nr:sugar kinase [Vibrio ponticus]OLQ89782.1 ketodeoxygluconokinase [Vibrio ponticus]
MKSNKIAIIGECMIELSGTPFGVMKQSFGGDTLNAAIYLARMSDEQVQTCYVSALGDDALSDGMIERWQDERINTDWVLRDNVHSTGLYMIHVDSEGERSFQYWRNQSAAKHMFQHSGWNRIAAQMADVKLIFLSGISLAILPEQDRQVLLTLLVVCKANGVEIVFDSNHRPALWQDTTLARHAYQQLLAITDIALVTFDDEAMVWQDGTPDDTLLRLKQLGVNKVVVKLGAQGCLSQDFQTQFEPQSIPANSVEQVVDTTSAGDSFNGAFLAQYVSGKPLSTCCQAGNLLASHVIQHSGAIIDLDVTTPIKAQIKELK